MKQKDYSYSNGYTIALVGCMILSFDTTIIRAINMPPDQIAFWRSFSMSLPVILMLLFSLIRKKRISSHLFVGKDIGLAAFFYGLSSVLFPVSAMTTSIPNMLFIVSTAPLWAAIFSRLFLHEKIDRKTVVSFIIAISGVCIVIAGSGFSVHTSTSIGDFTALLTAMSMAAAFTVGRASEQDLSFSPAIGSIFSCIILYALFDVNLSVSVDKFSLIILEGSIVVFSALSLIAKSSKYIPSTHLSFFLLLETVFGPVWVWLFFDEMPSEFALTGGAIILVALVFNSFASLHRRDYPGKAVNS